MTNWNPRFEPGTIPCFKGSFGITFNKNYLA